jgi:hypothetical protein
MWPFGRKREPADETRCAECGRTLLAGEWTQRTIDDDGTERYLCSLCAQATASALAEGTPGADADPEARASMNGRDGRRKSDAFWRVLKEKDAEIEDLQAQLARSEAEKEALLAELGGLRAAAGADLPATAGDEQRTALVATAAAEGAALRVQLDEASPAADGVEPAAGGEEAASAAEVASAAALTEVASGDGTVAERPEGITAADTQDLDLEDTLPGALPEGELAPVSGGDTSAPQAGGWSEDGQPQTDAPAADADAGGAADTDADADAEEAYLTEEELHLVQRGVDILNVSPVPKKIAETSENLGAPFVHVAVEPGAGISVTFVWALGWYRFVVSPEESGNVGLADRGYEELAGVKPNGVVRSDGTVQLSPTFGKRPTPREETAADTGPSVSTATVTSGVIISKSLMGQRTDDEAVVPWEGQNPRDLDWGR